MLTVFVGLLWVDSILILGSVGLVWGRLGAYIDVYGNTASKDQVKLSELNSDFSN